MALQIKHTAVLTGKAAEDFLNQVNINEAKPKIDFSKEIDKIEKDHKGEIENEETKIERNMNVISSFMEHCKNEGIEIPDIAFESYFGA